MEPSTPTPAPTEQLTAPEAQSRPNPKFKIQHIVISLLILAAGAGFLLSRSTFLADNSSEPTPTDKLIEAEIETNDYPAKPEVSRIGFQPLDDSTKQGFGLAAQRGLVLISLDHEHPEGILLEDGTTNSIRTVGIGESAIATSPNNQYIAYQTAEGRVVLMTTDRKQKVVLPRQLKVSMVGPWSPDSRKLIVRSDPRTMPKDLQGPQEPSDLLKYEKGNLLPGYYLIDIKSGTVTPIAPIVGFSGWVDAAQIFVSQTDSLIDSKYLYLFNVETYEGKPTNLYGSDQKYFSVQRTASHDGRKWAVTVWPSGQDTDKITTIIADFPNLEGTVIAEGIKTQNPLISPDGEVVVFNTQDELSGPQYTEFWRDGKITRVGKGIPLSWVNKTQFLYAEMGEDASTNPNEHLRRVFLHDVDNGQNWELFAP